MRPSRYAASGHLDAALDTCLRALLVDPGSPAIHLELSRLYFVHGWTSAPSTTCCLLDRCWRLEPDADVRGGVTELARAVTAASTPRLEAADGLARRASRRTVVRHATIGPMLDQLLELVRGFEVQLPIAILDIALTALLIYGLFSLIRGTRAVRLVIGVTVLYAIYVIAQLLGLQLLSRILQAGAVVGLLALVVVFQPELRRALERIGRVGSLGWLSRAGGASAASSIVATQRCPRGGRAVRRQAARSWSSSARPACRTRPRPAS